MAKSNNSVLPDVSANVQEVNNIFTESARKFGDLQTSALTTGKEAVTDYAKSFDFTGKSLDAESAKRFYEKNVAFAKSTQEQVTGYWASFFAITKDVSEKLVAVSKVA